ncbi:MAG: tRNA 2-thiouridine(34) synthase MnmA [Kiritimatiellae bacterium]|nr:tRNA 2-thiouridine(34) synthase MnmA [Kiritimatiellia bacterium]
MTDNASKPAQGMPVAVGMSGGVDSSVAAGLLVEQGYNVVGLTAVIRGCATLGFSEEHVEKARRVAEFFEIKHVVVDVREVFETKIAREFAAEYARGRTPSPCVRCNEIIKFGMLLDKARELGCAQLATGHYAYLQRRDDGWHLLKGWDGEKDQSYFLHRLSQSQLAQAMFPLGLWTKKRAVEWAGEMGLPVADTPESQDLCFVGDGDYAPFVEGYFPDLSRPGEIRDAAGRVLGRHQGFFRYTIGQRKGLGISAAEPLYVTALDPEHNVVVVGPREDVMRDRCLVEDVHWLFGKPPPSGMACKAFLRYRHAGAMTTLNLLAKNTVELRFSEPQFAVAPGQAAVMYYDNEVLGGGWIGRNG